MTATGSRPPGEHGSVAEEIAALAAALRARTDDVGGPRSERAGRDDDGPAPDHAPDGATGAEGGRGHRHGPDPGMSACEICPVCRAIALLHTVSPTAVSALADLAHQAELTLRALAEDLQARGEDGFTPTREDIPVDDLPDDLDEDLTDT